MIDRLAPPPSVPQARQGTPPARDKETLPFLDWLAPHSNSDGPKADPSLDGEVALPVSEAQLPPVLECSFEFHVQHARGEAEVFSLPWRLAANDSMAQTIASALRTSVSPAPVNHGSVAGPASGTIPASVLANQQATALGSAPMVSQHDLVCSPMPVHRAGATTVESLTAMPTALPSAIAMPWLTRLIRWIEQQGHDPAVWVRDYRLDDSAARLLVEGIRALAQEQGMQLERIVVNGRELWRATAQGQGACQ